MSVTIERVLVLEQRSAALVGLGEGLDSPESVLRIYLDDRGLVDLTYVCGEDKSFVHLDAEAMAELLGRLADEPIYRALFARLSGH